MKYLDYSINDFVVDEYFQRWVLLPDPDVNCFWESWLAQNPEKEKLVDEAREIVQTINFRRYDLPKDQSLKVWENINIGIDDYENHQKQKDSAESDPHMPMVRHWYIIAAIFLGIAIISSVWFLFRAPTKMMEYVTEYGETRTIVLPDSSTVILNSNSTLKYYLDWKKEKENSGKTSNTERKVWLEGEAYFNVLKSNSEANRSKFIVHTSNLDVEVLGTIFNVNNRRGKTEVVLNSGEVKLHTNFEAPYKESLIIKPGELVEFSGESKQFIRKDVDPEIYSSWRNNKMIFDEIPLKEIALILRDNYGIKVIFENSEMANKKFKGTFPADNIEVLLSTLSMSFDIRISKKKNQITFLE